MTPQDLTPAELLLAQQALEAHAAAHAEVYGPGAHYAGAAGELAAKFAAARTGNLS